ncbi:MAG TPA: serine hydrolase domain-containing protein, partial [Burkholderiaceae bacterium]|nr:serine hydrolase domain-containing protein [Burkholderiaceae bacterium]
MIESHARSDAATPAPLRDPQRAAASLQRSIDRLAARRGIPHLVVAVERGDGSFRWRGAAGVADGAGTPMRSDTPFFIASITKLLIAAAAMKLAEQQRLDIDRSIAAYLPRATVQGLHRIGGIDRSESITLRHLMSHTSGLPDWLEDSPADGRSVVDELLRDGDRYWTREQMLQRVRQQLHAHFPPQPLQAARARARYSNTNYQLLIASIEAATGLPIHDVLHEQLFAPLRMHDTWHPAHPPARIDRPVIAPAALWAGDRVLHAPLMLQSLEDYYSTTTDLLRLLRALTCGALFANPRTWPAMCARWIRFSLPRDRAALRSPS